MLRLVLKTATSIAVEADCIVPEQLAGKSPVEIAALPVQYGNAQAPLGDFFYVEGDAGDQSIVIEGDCSRVKRIGAGMAAGRILVEGNVGMHAGAQMRGGTLEVTGRAEDWAGAQMRGGTLLIRGDAGNLLGAAYRGSRTGMRGGVILVEGNAGLEIGAGMRRGLIAVRGDVGEFAGASMIAGTVFIFGKPGGRLAAGMKRGTIACLGGKPDVLPTFREDCVYHPVFLRIYLRWLREVGFALDDECLQRAYRRYSGDLVALGKGEILVAQ